MSHRRLHVTSLTLVLAAVALAGVGCSSSSNGSSSGGSPDGGTGTDGGGDGGGDGGTAASFSAFTPSNVDLTVLGDLSSVGDIDITTTNCGINSEQNSACFSADKVKFTVITQPNQIKVGVYVAHSWRIEPNASVRINGAFPIILVAT